MRILRGTAWVVVLLAWACASSAGAPGDAGADPATAPDDGPANDPRGFHVRVPGEHRIPLEDVGGQAGWTTAWDLDWMCTLRFQDLDGVLYVQLEPLKDNGWILGGVQYQARGAWLSLAGPGGSPVVQAVGVRYDTGGNHRNDAIELDRAGWTIRWYHSSFGENWRKCQPMDCLQVFRVDDRSLVQDGCTPERTLPIVCVEVGHDGTVPPLADAFEPCPPVNY